MYLDLEWSEFRSPLYLKKIIIFSARRLWSHQTFLDHGPGRFHHPEGHGRVSGRGQEQAGLHSCRSRFSFCRLQILRQTERRRNSCPRRGLFGPGMLGTFPGSLSEDTSVRTLLRRDCGWTGLFAVLARLFRGSVASGCGRHVHDLFHGSPVPNSICTTSGMR